jgi:hypothetical protein
MAIKEGEYSHIDCAQASMHLDIFKQVQRLIRGTIL